MRKHIIAIIAMLAVFSALQVLARHQETMQWKLLVGAASGVAAGLVALYVQLYKSAAGLLTPIAAHPDDEPRLRWWFYGGGVMLGVYFGSLLALGNALPDDGPRLVVTTAAGVLEAFAFVSFAKAVRAGDRAKGHAVKRRGSDPASSTAGRSS
jgi:hypothetical protein